MLRTDSRSVRGPFRSLSPHWPVGGRAQSEGRAPRARAARERDDHGPIGAPEVKDNPFGQGYRGWMASGAAAGAIAWRREE
jgi:hypothetical protein